MWKSALETAAEIEKLEEVERLERLFALCWYWKNAVFPEAYRADEEWLNLIDWKRSNIAGIHELLEKENSFKRKSGCPIGLGEFCTTGSIIPTTQVGRIIYAHPMLENY